MGRNLFSFSLRGGPRASICFVCVEAVYVFYVLMSYHFLDYLVKLYVCIYGVRGGMHDTELSGEKRFGGPGQASDLEPGEHDEQGQGRMAFHKLCKFWGRCILNHLIDSS